MCVLTCTKNTDRNDTGHRALTGGSASKVHRGNPEILQSHHGRRRRRRGGGTCSSPTQRQRPRDTMERGENPHPGKRTNKAFKTPPSSSSSFSSSPWLLPLSTSVVCMWGRGKRRGWRPRFEEEISEANFRLSTKKSGNYRWRQKIKKRDILGFRIIFFAKIRRNVVIEEWGHGFILHIAKFKEALIIQFCNHYHYLCVCVCL